MLTDLHKKLKGMCMITRGDGMQHWILIGCVTIWVPEVQEIVTTKRAVYAAFVGDIPENAMVVSTCGSPCCLKPEHLELASARGHSRSLGLPVALAAFRKERAGYMPHALEQVLPEGLTVRLIELVKFLSRDGSTVEQIRQATGLKTPEIMRIRGGAYDEAVRNVRGATVKRAATREKVRTATGRMKPGTGAQVPVPGPAELGADAPRRASGKVKASARMTDEEAAWLRQIGRG